MSDYIISCCSSADLTKERMEECDLKCLCFKYELGGVQYTDDLGQTVPYDEFYAQMAAGADTATSQINAQEYADYFRPFLEQGLDILHVTLSSGLTGTYNSCRIAKEDLQEEFPDRKIYIVDGLGASGGHGLMMVTLSDMKKDGATIDELYDFIENNKLRMQHWFFSTDLQYYIRGGRISKTAGFVGNLLNICPLLNMDDEGHLIPRMKVRTKRKVKEEIVNKMKEHAEDGVNYSGKVYITHSSCLEDAEDVAALIKENFPNVKDIPIWYIGSTIGAHTGPGTVALFFWGDVRVR